MPRRGSNNQGKVAKLVYNTSYGGKMVFELAKDETTMGRREDNHISLSDGKISKYHASIIRNPNGKFGVKDKNSSNGIRVCAYFFRKIKPSINILNLGY
jgi:adenylate cyclase